MVFCRAHKDRCIWRAQVTAGGEIWRAKNRWAHALDQPCIRDQVSFAWQMLGDNGADVGRFIGNSLLYPFLRLTAQEVVHGVEVVADAAGVSHRAY